MNRPHQQAFEPSGSLDSIKLQRLAIISGVAIGIAALLAATGWIAAERFWPSYLVAAIFCASISIGGLFFVLLHHLIGTKWSEGSVRWLAERIAAVSPWNAITFLPVVLTVVLGSHVIYHWNDPEVVAGDPVLAAKAPYLNASFFTLRALAYFVVWCGLSLYYLRLGRDYDRTADTKIRDRMSRFSGPGMILFSVTVCFAGFDWLMSLEPHWFSSIFGVYFFSGAVVGFVAVLILVTFTLERSGVIRRLDGSRVHDLGKWLFGFTFFWAYIAFSQYLLIWYANIPEETSWFASRQYGGWQWVSVTLVLGHFAFPFFGLMSRAAKRSRRNLTFWCLVLLAMHWIDLYWIVLPTFFSRPTFSPVDLLLTAGLFGLFLTALGMSCRGQPREGAVAYGNAVAN